MKNKNIFIKTFRVGAKIYGVGRITGNTTFLYFGHNLIGYGWILTTIRPSKDHKLKTLELPVCFQKNFKQVLGRIRKKEGKGVKLTPLLFPGLIRSRML